MHFLHWYFWQGDIWWGDLWRTTCWVQKVSELAGNCYERGGGGVWLGVRGSCVHAYLTRHRFPVVQPPKHLPTSISCGRLATQREGNQLTARHKYWLSWVGARLPFFFFFAFNSCCSTPAGAICVCTALALSEPRDTMCPGFRVLESYHSYREVWCLIVLCRYLCRSGMNFVCAKWGVCELQNFARQ